MLLLSSPLFGSTFKNGGLLSVFCVSDLLPEPLKLLGFLLRLFESYSDFWGGNCERYEYDRSSNMLIT